MKKQQRSNPAVDLILYQYSLLTPSQLYAFQVKSALKRVRVYHVILISIFLLIVIGAIMTVAFMVRGQQTETTPPTENTNSMIIFYATVFGISLLLSLVLNFMKTRLSHVSFFVFFYAVGFFVTASLLGHAGTSPCKMLGLALGFMSLLQIIGPSFLILQVKSKGRVLGSISN
jgi:membrane-associated HD superfamily phosphohydrolase